MGTFFRILSPAADVNTLFLLLPARGWLLQLVRLRSFKFLECWISQCLAAALALKRHHQSNFIFPLSGGRWKYKNYLLFQRKTRNRGPNVVSGFPLMFSDCILLPLGEELKVLNPPTEFSVSPSQSVQASAIIPVLAQLFWSVSDALVDQGVILPNGFLGCLPGGRNENYGHELCSRARAVAGSWKICQPQAEILLPFLRAQTLEAHQFHFHSFI